MVKGVSRSWSWLESRVHGAAACDVRAQLSQQDTSVSQRESQTCSSSELTSYPQATTQRQRGAYLLGPLPALASRGALWFFRAVFFALYTILYSTNIYIPEPLRRAYLDRDPSFYLNLVWPTGRLLPYRVPHEGDAETHSRRCSSSHDGARARVAPGASPPASGRSLAAPAPSAPHGSPAGSRRGRTFGDRPHVRRQTPVSTRS